MSIGGIQSGAARVIDVVSTTVEGRSARPGLRAATNADRLNRSLDAVARANTGFTGADGWYGTALPDDRLVWSVGDMFVGGIRPDGGRVDASRHAETFVRGGVLVSDGQRTDTLLGPQADRLIGRGAFVEPAGTVSAPVELSGAQLPTRWYWPGHTTNDGPRGAAMIMTPWEHGEGDPRWNWRDLGTDVVHVDLSAAQPTTRVTHVNDDTTAIWGAAGIDLGEHTYVYGVDSASRDLTTARVPRGQLDGPWQYRTAGGWSLDAADAQRTIGPLPPQFSVIRTPGTEHGVTLLAQPGFESRLDVHHAASPLGPFTPAGSIPLPALTDGDYTYNALVHEHLSDPTHLLVAMSRSNPGDDVYTGFAGDYRNYLPRFAAVERP